MKIAAIGRTQFLYASIEKLLASGHDIGAVITAPASKEYAKTQSDFETFAKERNIPYCMTKTLDDPKIAELCSGMDVAVSVNWISIIQQKHIDWFRVGILNAHFGDLPRYRGNACPNWAVLMGEKELTLSVHMMEPGRLDCGRVLAQKKRGLNGSTTMLEIYNWSENATPELFLEAVNRLSKDTEHTLKYADPNSAESFRCYPRIPEDGFIDWEKQPEEVSRLIRAAGAPFQGAYTYQAVGDALRKLIICEARIVQHESKDLAVAGQILKNDTGSGESWVRCGDGVLALIQCRYSDEPDTFAPGRRWKSIRARVGIRLEDWLWRLTQNGVGENSTGK